MPIAKKEFLIELIEGLNSGEKRFFTRYTNQTGSGATDKFYRLFRHLSDGGALDDPGLTELLGLSGPTQLVNLQRHLYGRLLDSLRLQHRRRDAGIQVREQVDYANLLYDRRPLPPRPQDTGACQGAGLRLPPRSPSPADHRLREDHREPPHYPCLRRPDDLPDLREPQAAGGDGQYGATVEPAADAAAALHRGGARGRCGRGPQVLPALPPPLQRPGTAHRHVHGAHPGAPVPVLVPLQPAATAAGRRARRPVDGDHRIAQRPAGAGGQLLRQGHGPPLTSCLFLPTGQRTTGRSTGG